MIGWMGKMRVDAYFGAQALFELGDWWNECVMSWLPSNRAIFVTKEWLSTWWEHFGKGLPFLLCVKDYDEPICLAPLFITRLNALGSDVIRFIGSGISDYGEVAVKPRRGVDAVNALMNYLVSHRHLWDAVELCDLSVASPFASLIKAWCDEFGWRFGIGYEMSYSEVCPVLNLPQSFEELTATVDGSLRNTLKRRERQIRKLFDVEFGIVKSEVERCEVVEQMFKLHTQRWLRKFQPGMFSLPSSRNFHRRWTKLALKKGWLNMHFLKLDGAYAAVHYCFGFGNAACYYGGGFMPEFGKYSVGTILMAHVLKHAIEDGKSIFDFLRGSERYKLMWGAVPMANINIRLFWKRNIRSTTTVSFMRLRSKVLQIARCIGHKLR